MSESLSPETYIHKAEIAVSGARVLLIRRRGRVGSYARQLVEHFDYEALARAALQRQAERKRRRGYADSFCS